MPESIEGASPVLLLEFWKPIPELNDRFEISNLGNLRHSTRGTFRKFVYDKGYAQVLIPVNGKTH